MHFENNFTTAVVRVAAATATLIIALYVPARAAEQSADGTAQAASGTDDASIVDAVVSEQMRENELSAKIQDEIDEIADDTDAMAVKYRSALQNTRQLEIYNRQLEGLIEAQNTEMASLRQQIDGVTVVSRTIMPHMEDMLEALEKFVDLDMPFLVDERHERVAKLRELMGRADVTISEKYRRILEAYQIENEYGRTIEAYRGTIDDDGARRTVDFLRVGRNALLYQTLDGTESGVWNQKTRTWEPADRYRNSLRDGLRMARKQVAPDLLTLPMPAPEVLR
jgi:hypothetical protein